MPKLLKKFTVHSVVSPVAVCPECESASTVIDNGDSYHVECPKCGVQGFRYMSEAEALQDFPNHYALPKKKIDK